MTLSPGKGAITTRWIYKLKSGSSDQSLWHKSRLVAGGFQQYGVDYGDNFALVVFKKTISIIFAFAAHQNGLICHLDAFLNGVL